LVVSSDDAARGSAKQADYHGFVAVGVKRQHGVEKVIGALLKAEISAKQVRSINYRLGIAKLLLAIAQVAYRGSNKPRSWRTSASRVSRSILADRASRHRRLT